jgi:hypothetical protein
MSAETDYTPWVAFITGFNWLQSRFMGTPTETLLAVSIQNHSMKQSRFPLSVPSLDLYNYPTDFDVFFK